MQRSSRFVLAVMGLFFFVGFTSAGVLDSLTNKKKTTFKTTGGYREWPTNSSSTVVPTADGGQLVVDMCEADIVVPLSSPRIAPRNFTVKSTQFPFQRSTPLICSWNIKASASCRRGLITMTINERSRLSGDKGCHNGYYTVSPLMDDIKICGRVHFVPAFQWYVEDQQPPVAISLKHVGLDDGYSEGLAFTLSGECLPDASEMSQKKATQSYRHWLQQLATRSLHFGVPTVVLPDGLDLETILPDGDDQTDEPIDGSTTTTPSSVTKTKPPKKNGVDFDLETPWHLLKNQSTMASVASVNNVNATITKSPAPVDSTKSEPHPIIELSYQTLNRTLPSTTLPNRKAVPTKPPGPSVALVDLFNLETPWHVLRNQSLLANWPTKNDTASSPAQTVELILWT